MTLSLPPSLAINAWTGEESPSSPLDSGALVWGLKRRATPPDELLAPAPAVDFRDWKHGDVGWGLVLPENETITPAARATADDAPEPIQKLLASRPGSPVLRYRANLQNGYLRRYTATGSYKEPALAGGLRGVSPGALPRYLLIYGTPDVIPWQFQYTANMSCYVGRLSLTGERLSRYVEALVNDWKNASSHPEAPVVWSVNKGEPDISWLMDHVISRPLFDAFGADTDLQARQGCFGATATASELGKALSKAKPSLILTTSHGKTGPLNIPAQMRADLGLLVDAQNQVVRPEDLLATWSPGGSIWYAHACCSAGSDAQSRYVDLFDAGSSIVTVLAAVAKSCGASVAPFPEALLGAESPLRAFVGHVEPTFDWTLRDPETGQPLVHSLRDALYQRLYQQSHRVPIAYALEKVFVDAGAFLMQWLEAVDAVNKNEPKARERALYRQLAALDRIQTVILGDPTVALPLLH